LLSASVLQRCCGLQTRFDTAFQRSDADVSKITVRTNNINRDAALIGVSSPKQ
jgi:hypothetical protein